MYIINSGGHSHARFFSIGEEPSQDSSVFSIEPPSIRDLGGTYQIVLERTRGNNNTWVVSTAENYTKHHYLCLKGKYSSPFHLRPHRNHQFYGMK